MTIGKLCSRIVVFASRRESVADAAKLMREQHVGTLVVVDERGPQRVPVGMITDRDIAVGVVALGLDPGTTEIGDVMSPEVITVRETDGLAETVALMRARGVRRVPVTDAHGTLVGLLAADDVLELLAEEIAGLASTVVSGEKREKATRRAAT